jgi:methylated-DNA-[protein]-cysteine S-methyltransferase
MKYDVFDSPLGGITICTNGTAVTELHIEGDRYFTAIPSEWIKSPQEPLLLTAKQELTEYFAGARKTFDIPLKAAGTDFQKQVWKALETIEPSDTSSYSKIAAKIGRPKAVRAVGTAIGRNPICIMVPCHRVLASNGSLGGFVAGLERKQQLLQLEHAL